VSVSTPFRTSTDISAWDSSSAEPSMPEQIMTAPEKTVHLTWPNSTSSMKWHLSILQTLEFNSKLLCQTQHVQSRFRSTEWIPFLPCDAL